MVDGINGNGPRLATSAPASNQPEQSAAQRREPAEAEQAVSDAAKAELRVIAEENRNAASGEVKDVEDLARELQANRRAAREAHQLHAGRVADLLSA